MNPNTHYYLYAKKMKKFIMLSTLVLLLLILPEIGRVQEIKDSVVVVIQLLEQFPSSKVNLRYAGIIAPDTISLIWKRKWHIKTKSASSPINHHAYAMGYAYASNIYITNVTTDYIYNIKGFRFRIVEVCADSIKIAYFVERE